MWSKEDIVVAFARAGSTCIARRAGRFPALCAVAALFLVGLPIPALAVESAVPDPGWVWLSEPWTVVGADDHPVSPSSTPELGVNACYAPEFVPAGGAVVDYKNEIKVEGSDGHLVSSDALTPVFDTFDDGWTCGEAMWRPGEDLHAAIAYRLFGRTLAPDGAESEWLEGEPFTIAAPLPVPTRGAPADGEILSSNRPTLTAHVPNDPVTPLQVAFRLVSSQSSLVVGEGTSDVGQDGDAIWEVPAALGAGDYTWQVQLTDETAQSDWSLEGQFSILPPPVPESISPAEGAELGTQQPILSARLGAGDPGQLRGVFRVVRSDSGVAVAEGRSEPADAAGSVAWTVPVVLTAGDYTWQVLATDDVSQSEWSAERAFTVGLPPGQPDLFSTSQYRLGVGLQWFRAQTSDDAPILDYTISAMPGNYSVTVPPSGGNFNSAILTDVPPGSYTVSVVARNKYGQTSPNGVSSRPVVVYPAQALAPENLSVELDGDTAQLAWERPADDGGVPILEYAVKDWPAQQTRTVPATQTSTIYTNLAFGVWYSVSVAATTERGTGEAAWVGFQPFTVPEAPSDVSARLGDHELDVTWTAPSFDGGSALVGYRIVASPGGAAMTVGADPRARFVGLDNGTDYTFTVAAINEAGQGPASSPSAPRAPLSQGVDSDGDGLPDILEERAGSNSLLIDSDFDGLNDADEVLHLTGITSPVSPDTNGDGSTDAQADADGDGLTNLVELSDGLEPANPDTDGDGLRDGDERQLGTDPLSSDTDGDGIGDPDESSMGLDPTIADSDADGSEDAAEQVEVVLQAKGVTASVAGPAQEIVGASLAATAVSVVDGAVTPAVTITPGDPAADDVDEAAAGASTATALTADLLVFDLPDSHEVAGREFGAFAWDPSAVSWAPAPNQVSSSESEHSVTIHSASP